ncbi:MAG: type II toxin-antitoxin system VapC family toxin [Gammaproteobacteria bacterium]|nr:type II toxin-antitoxin system VapC family toxin [Gammaproteobacteria bacterium]
MGLIYLDSCRLIYLVESDPFRAPQVRQAMSEYRDGSFAVSALVRLECLVHPLRTGDARLARRYKGALERLHWLTIPDEVYDLAAELRARHGLKTPDALHLACARHHACEALWTNDDRLATAAPSLARAIGGI